jgi:hypothetical protein
VQNFVSQHASAEQYRELSYSSPRMQTPMLRVLLYFLSVRQCFAAITWRAIGCDGWDYEGTSMTAIWDNAVEMATQAQSQIDLIPSNMFKTQTEAEKIAGGNANFMFNVNFRDHRGLDKAGRATMNTVKSE